jgi:hypothetical protein
MKTLPTLQSSSLTKAPLGVLRVIRPSTFSCLIPDEIQQEGFFKFLCFIPPEWSTPKSVRII